ncbi:GPI2-domain-containing protein [Coniophora puteana RWD-64-598 SS2]|uniref:GPI2-domain-containing protein n=1 Tax=Coniophora puteana (strain RWD-64-598) TaxID=741705 RepID=A0A5M3N602_CONPW|nr:GPI2-domain-containing protein [Coniophora puteana RWD-64-598 SS2]EIW86697.1 GPI2-domain-containing protein [Coniophora puteana RWD-64-598 SS2]
MTHRSEWQKALWFEQDYPDNYIPPKTFLSSLRRNPNFKPYEYWPLVFLTSSITQHMCSVALFLTVFVRLKEQTLDARTLLWATICGSAFTHVFFQLLSRAHTSCRNPYPDKAKLFTSSFRVFLVLLSLTPVLRGLAAAASSDSARILAVLLFALNTLLADYTTFNPSETSDGLASLLSLNAAIGSSTLLASRLRDDLAVFSLVFFSVQLFSLFPRLRRQLQACFIISLTIIDFLLNFQQVLSNTIRLSLTAALAISSIASMVSLSMKAACVYAMILFAVTFLSPGLLVWAQKYKNEIRGPWDVAIPKIN